MKTNDNIEMDLLKNYLNRESIEEAPEGFTGKVMSAISVERAPSFRKYARIRSIAVPAGVVLLMAALIILAVLTLKSSDGTVEQKVTEILSQLKFPEAKTGIFPAIDIPVILFYISTGIIALGLLDLIMGRYFYRKTS